MAIITIDDPNHTLSLTYNGNTIQLVTPTELVNQISQNNTDQVNVTPYRPNPSGSFNSGTSYREFFNFEHKSRIRQTGDVTKCIVPSGSSITNPDITGFFICIWRENTQHTFDQVVQSENILSALVSGGPNQDTEVVFQTPLSGVQEGDYVSFKVTTISKVNGFIRKQDGANSPACYYTNTAPTSTNYDWEAQNSNDFYVPIQLFMQAPNVCALGDSITAGHNTNWSFAETEQISCLSTQVVKKVCDNYNWSFQNAGVGGGQSRIGNGLSRFDKDIRDKKPKACIIGHGTGDINAGITTQSITDDMTAILQKCQDNSIIPIVLSVYPRTDFDDTKSQTRRDINNTFQTLTASFNGLFVNTDEVLGQIRASTNELDDLIPEYTSDDIHLTEAGNVALANQILSVLGGS